MYVHILLRMLWLSKHIVFKKRIEFFKLQFQFKVKCQSINYVFNLGLNNILITIGICDLLYVAFI